MGYILSKIGNNRDRLGFITIWTVIVLTIFLIQISYEKRNTEKLAEIEAISTYRSDLNFRSWMSSHGGVYIPVTEETRPNPYLESIPEQNIETPSQRELTLMNPAWAIRSLNEHNESSTKAKSHITSLNLLRPGNAPDEWEIAALQAFETGVPQISEITTIGDVLYYRYMKPLKTESGCLKCHGQQGYEVGDVRGGISVSLLYAPYLEIEKRTIIEHGTVLLIIYIAVLLIILKHVNIIRKRNETIVESNKLLHKEINHSSAMNQMLEREIEKQKIAEREKEKMLEQLHRMNKLEGLSVLAGGVAHDFNNILQGISSSSQLLLMPRRKLDDKALKYAENIYRASLRGADLTSKLLTYSKNERTTFKSMDLHLLIDDVVGFLFSTIDKKIDIRVEKDARNSHISGDENALKNALTNLIINSSHAISSKGIITVKSGNISYDKVHSDAFLFDLPAGDYCMIEVHDTGAGIPAELIDKIFDPFFTTKPKGAGTGLGLTLVYSTVQKHKGTIEISSNPESGTSVKMILPCKSQSLRKENRETKLSMGTGTVLLVDDEEINRVTGSEILESLGYNVLTAADGEEALAIYQSNYSIIDLVLLDMIMPNIDGRETFDNLKKFDKDCKVIIASGYSKNGTINRMMEEGLLGFIKKPYTIPELDKVISELIS